jgi:DNA processing protein
VPIILFAWGQVDAFSRFHDYLAIVGSRKADKYGLTIAEEISLVAAAQGLCVVSGLAYGVDAAAHRGALASKNSFSTIAILGSGLNKLYPPNHYALAIDIVTKGGVILSQFEPNMPPLPANFLNRNRLIAGLSSAVLVIQAPEKSGSLNTARYALEEGREVLVVPGPIYDERYRGSNLLIKQGAHVITSSNDVLEFYPNVENNRKNNLINSSNAISLDENSSKLLAMLKSSGQLHVEELKTVLTSEDEFSSLLLFLELEGYIQRLPGNYIGIKPRL